MLCMLCGAAMLAVLSCQRVNEDVGPSALSPHSLDEIKVVDGRLVFPDHDTMLETVRQINEIGPEEWSKKYPAFRSLLTTFDEFRKKASLLSTDEKAEFRHCYRYTVDKDGGRLLEPSVSGRTMGSLVNAHGLVQIGDSVLRISDEKVLKVHVSNINGLDEKKSAQVKEYEVIDSRREAGKPNARIEHTNVDYRSIVIGGGSYTYSGENYRFQRATRMAMYNTGWGYSFRDRRFGFMWVYEVFALMVHEKASGSNWNLENTNGWSHTGGYINIYGANSPIVRYQSYPSASDSGQRPSYGIALGDGFTSSTGSTNYWGITFMTGFTGSTSDGIVANFKDVVQPPGYSSTQVQSGSAALGGTL